MTRDIFCHLVSDWDTWDSANVMIYKCTFDCDEGNEEKLSIHQQQCILC